MSWCSELAALWSAVVLSVPSTGCFSTADSATRQQQRRPELTQSIRSAPSAEPTGWHPTAEGRRATNVCWGRGWGRSFEEWITAAVQWLQPERGPVCNSAVDSVEHAVCDKCVRSLLHWTCCQALPQCCQSVHSLTSFFGSILPVCTV